jgi:hypothetical protein
MFMKSFVKGSRKQVLAVAAVLSIFSPFVAASAFAESFAVVVPAAASASRSVVTQRESFVARASDVSNREVASNVADEKAAILDTTETARRQQSQQSAAARMKAAEKPIAFQ